MDLCDASVIDWDAWSAVGTWVVGLAAIYIAAKANALSAQIRGTEKQRNEQATRIGALGVHLDLKHYALRLEHYAENLKRHAELPATFPLADAIDTFENMEFIRLSDQSVHVANLPVDIGKRLSFIYAQERTIRTSFQLTLKNLRKLESLPPSDSSDIQLKTVMAKASMETMRVADGVFEAVEALAKYLGLEPDANE
jgi:hypothetical protein